jgi:hypothetical protein
MEKVLAIQFLYPDAVIFIDFIVENDGNGNETINMWNLKSPQPTDAELQTAWIGYLKEQKKIELDAKCQETILSGFTSSNGHSYSFDVYDQANFTGKLAQISADTTILTVNTKTKDAGVIQVTRDEYIQICNEASNHKESNLGKLWSLEADVDNLPADATEDQINAIVW